MPSSNLRHLTVISLVLWLLASCAGQGLQLHVSVAHADGGPHDEHDLPALPGHAESGAHPEHDHDHELSSTASDPANTAPRLQSLPLPGLALLPVEWSPASRGTFGERPPRPRPRARPPGLQNLNILRI